MPGGQRRRYTRVAICIDVECKETNNPTNSFKTKTIDMSGGGIKIILPDNKKIGTLLDCSVILGDNNIVNAQGIIAWLGQKSAPSGAPVYECGLQFTQIDLESRQRIISAVYEALRKRHNQ